MEFLIVTGLSGAGKSRAVDALEDIGFYCVDNIPPKLIPTFYDLCAKAGNTFSRVAVVTDIRGGDMFSSLFETLDDLKNEDKHYRILFLDANDYVLINRFKETRRKHPLAENNLGSLEQAVKLEREILRPVREKADYIIDTSFLSPAQLKERISNLFLGDSSQALMVHCVSFGFKYGIPTEADLVFDVRCLPNPFYIEELKHLTGLDEPVYSYVMKWEQTKGVVQRLISLIDYMLPLYCDEGKSQLVIAIGCTGGKHRSVALAQLLYDHLLENGHRTSVNHRDIQK
ncbi:MAG: RNase adapter RapZ [Clostridium sp.]|uniref:RNase adapter RapZ n=1 Tax=Anaeromassilibacillus senegalensis TaxID=1673717 RepID=A0ABS9MFW4_9FIRM|nr:MULTISPECIES: RNase adapter RapZ [Anaeromassilibacillus]MBS5621614.1 RNase adapter RapZ [Clostridium sp.]MCG4609680.1 RNase adapter RapZ [Anaeromassilibacillus senegalensis]HJB50660.1 RNase adapter RapZ [Candidatus Anaeromassilibacillus stercoravium]